MTALSPLLAYAPYQARDALLRAIMPVALFAAMGGVPLWAFAGQEGFAAIQSPGPQQSAALTIYTQTLSLAMTLGAIVLVHGLAALDRERQYFRFPFAQPVVPWQYYLQQFAIGTALYVAFLAIIPIGFSLVITDVPVLPVLQSALLYALLYGSLALLTGSLLNRDGVLYILVVIVGFTLQQLDRSGALSDAMAAVAHALPPFAAADAVRTSWLAERALEGNDLTLVVGYSLGMLVSALYLIRNKALAR